MRNMLATLLLSQGVPMILGGDEFARTQRGNNNAYAQDNELSWVDWSLADLHREQIDFVMQLCELRRSRLWLRRDTFLKGSSRVGSAKGRELAAPRGARDGAGRLERREPALHRCAPGCGIDRA
jgi:pullulanase/glycogen debranching enzyme